MTPIEVFALLGAGLLVWLASQSSAVNNSAGTDVNTDGAGDVNSGTVTPPATADNSPATTSSSPSALETWANAIFHFEGGGPLDRNVRNNNPGNLKFAGQPGATGADADGFAIFSSFDLGFAALIRQLQKYVNVFPSLNFTQIQAHYLGQSDYLTPKVTAQGNPFTYADAVAKALGVNPDATLQNTFGG